MNHQVKISLPGYGGRLHPEVIAGNGREKPAFLISNDFDFPVALLVANYSGRGRVEKSSAKR